MFSRWKYWYDNMLNDIAVESALHLQASNVMETGFKNYIHDFKQNDQPDADAKLLEFQTEFNKHLTDIVHKAEAEKATAEKLNEEYMLIQEKLISSSSILMDTIAGLPNRHLSWKQS